MYAFDKDEISDLLVSKPERKNFKYSDISTLNENYPSKGGLYINLTPKKACPVKLKLTRREKSPKKEDITVTESTAGATQFFLVDSKDNNKVEELSLDRKLSLEFPEEVNKTEENRYALSFGRSNFTDDCWKSSSNNGRQITKRSNQEHSVYRKDEYTISVKLASLRKNNKNVPNKVAISVIDPGIYGYVYHNNGVSIDDTFRISEQEHEINLPLLETSSYIVEIKSLEDGKVIKKVNIR